jgi:hypothetical protein
MAMQRNTPLARMSRSLNPQRLSTGLAGLCVGCLLGVIPNLIATPAILIWAAPVLGGVALVSGLVSLLLPQKLSVDTAIRSPQSIRRPEDAALYARRGLVGFVSLYNNPGKLSPEELQGAIDTLDFAQLRLEESNLQPMLHGIRAHAGQLEHCWLIATVGQQALGSLPYARVMAEYLRQEQGLECAFYYGEGYTVSLDDDTDVLQRTYDLLVRRVFKEAQRAGLSPQDLVADFTAGIRSMTLGMVLACLDKERDIEFVGTRYDLNGRMVKGDLTPIIFSFDPQLKPDDR